MGAIDRIQRASQIPPRQLTVNEQQIIEEAVSRSLIDPYSAAFGHMPLRSKEGYCGVVNAKNRMGGYAGKAFFLVKPVWNEDVMRGAVLIGIDRGGDAGAIGIMCVKMGLLPEGK